MSSRVEINELTTANKELGISPRKSYEIAELHEWLKILIAETTLAE